jgi:L-amino acid N-acyltransferase YncA
MTKIRVDTDELNNLIYERLIESSQCPRGFPVAVIPENSVSGWSVVAAYRARKRHPACAERLALIQREMQSLYVLRR